MKKTVEINFPDDFIFPKKYGEYNCERHVKLKNGEYREERYSPCTKCVFENGDDYESWCDLISPENETENLCPFRTSNNVKIEYGDNGYPHVEN